jgi:hypothetical protein
MTDLKPLIAAATMHQELHLAAEMRHPDTTGINHREAFGPHAASGDRIVQCPGTSLIDGGAWADQAGDRDGWSPAGVASIPCHPLPDDIEPTRGSMITGLNDADSLALPERHRGQTGGSM